MKYESDRRSSPLFAPTPPREETEPPVCRRSERCKGCPHARHGFICWHRDGICLKTDMEEIDGSQLQTDNLHIYRPKSTFPA